MNSFTRFYSSLGLLILLNLLIKPVWIFGIDLQVQNIVGTRAYGNYFSIFNLAVVFSFLTDWGFTIFFSRSASAMPGVYIKRASSYGILKIVFAVIYAAIVFLVAWISGINDWLVVVLVVMIQVLTSFYLFLRSIITATQKFRIDAWLSILDKSLMILICGTFIYLPFVSGNITLQSFLVIQVLSIAAAVLVSIVILINLKLSFSPINPAHLNNSLFKAALPFALLVFLMSVHNRADAFLLERLHPDGNYEAGIYAAAYRLLDAFLMPGNLVIAFLLPFIAKKLAEKSNFSAMIINVRHFLIMLMVGIISIGYMLAPWIQDLLYNHDPIYGAVVLQWTLLSLIGYTLIQVYGTILTASGKLHHFVITIFITAMLNVMLNLLLIPQMGAKGSAIAAFISQNLCGLYLAFVVSKKYHLPLHKRSIIVYVFSLLTYLIILQTGLQWEVNEWLLILSCVIAGMLIVFFSKTPDWRNTLFSVKYPVN